MTKKKFRPWKLFWVKDFGLVSPNIQPPFDEDLLSAGREVHESSCLDCHASAQWAFTGYATAKIIKPIAIWLDEIGGVTILWYIHFIACFAGLAYLPFSKMFHIICTPLSLIANQVMDPGHSAPANVLTRQIMELDACTHCGSCSLNCSAAMIYEAIGNENILPSEKIACLKKMVAGKQLDPGQIEGHRRRRLFVHQLRPLHGWLSLRDPVKRAVVYGSGRTDRQRPAASVRIDTFFFCQGPGGSARDRKPLITIRLLPGPGRRLRVNLQS